MGVSNDEQLRETMGAAALKMHRYDKNACCESSESSGNSDARRANPAEEPTKYLQADIGEFRLETIGEVADTL